jgi:hypothetical protein
MVEVDLGGRNSFIAAWYLAETGVCDELIAYFNSSVSTGPGKVGDGIVDVEAKDSIDHQIECDHFSDPPVFRYLNNLIQLCHAYVDKYRASATLDSWGIAEKINIQHYQPNGGYKVWHCERWGRTMPSAARHLAFMTYLNDVSDGGGTEFLYQEITVQPKKGLTLIWPSDWTHYHRGIVSPTEEKYIITGWFSFL